MAKRTLGILAATGAFALTASLTGAGTVQASPSKTLYGCPSGYICFYEKTSVKSRIVFKTAGNWKGGEFTTHAAFNNGKRYPGADHVRYTYHYPDSPEKNRTDCHTYHSTDSPVATPGASASFIERHVSKVEWVGSC
ncbi:hypothetical protein DSC45_04105 [Streptomyces sp. YIM 130001]|uniref:hypothetical protein n=1 Tax=Streptomyces sp. YIM 130001 TaxID=2259644 RepID=UPI000E65BED9|nr:hypothetical protein [Streptomyces sp. YIM 130001]RII20387.1 hypothetical protein DSC45_04105 [Streptomyces sp. YIM 130001]